MKKMNLFFSDFDGCMYDLHPTGGTSHDFLKKPWRFATNIPDILPRFNQKCTGVDEYHQHQPTRGKNATDSQYYTPMITRQIHECIRSFFHNQEGNTTPRHTPSDGDAFDSTDPQMTELRSRKGLER